MAATRAVRGKEGRGIAIAVAAHVVIIGLLSVQWTAGERRFDNPPMEVDLIAETAVQSTAPVISENPPAARLGEEDMTDIAAPEPMPAPPLPEPIVRPTPAPTPKQVARPKAQPKQTPPAAAKAQPKAAPKAASGQEPPRPPDRTPRRHRRGAVEVAAEDSRQQGRTRRRDRRRGQTLDRRQHQIGGRAALEPLPGQRLRCRSAQDGGQVPPDPSRGARRFHQHHDNWRE